MKVSDIMTRDVISVREDTPLREVAQLLARRRITGVPVCDDDGHLAGLLSEYDLIARPEATTAGEAMTRDVIAVMEDTSVDEVRHLLVNRRIRRVPVLRGQKVVGVVSRSDLVREMAFSWVCEVCGDSERGPSPPDVCPKCGVPSGFNLSAMPPVGEGADVPVSTCPTCGQALPR